MQELRAIYRIAREADLASDPDAARLHALWASLCSADGVPLASALDPASLAWCRDQIEIMIPLGDGVYHFAHHGKNLAAASGFELEGKNTGIFKSQVGQFFAKSYALAEAGRQPVYAFNESALLTPVHAWSRHLFPLFHDDGSHAYSIGLIKPILQRHQVWQSVSDIVGFGAGSLEPIFDNQGIVNDFLIVEAAGMSSLLKDESPATLNQLLRRQISQATIDDLLSPNLGQTMLSEVIELHIDDRQTFLEVEIIASQLGLIINMRDITVMRATQAQLEKRTDELRLAQQIGRIGGWRMGLNDSTIWWSAEMYELMRLTPAAFIPTTKAVWALYEDGDADRTGEAQRLVLKTGEPRSVDVSAKRGEGSMGHFTITISLDRDSHGEIIGYVGTIQDITERKQAEINLERLAYFDPLTSLPNRAMFKKELEHRVQSAIITGRIFHLLLMDLDKFKDVNDALGHGAGDSLLVRVARLLREITPKDAMVARLGGDEFAILFQSQAGGVSVDDLASGIVRQCTDAFLLDEGEVQIGVSIGISEALKDGVKSEHLLKNADLALYAAKDGGRGRYNFYQNTMSEQAEVRMNLSRDLKKALAENTLELHFQPTVELSSNAVTGFEALLRWKHPVRGYIPPSEFIPIAESSSLICDLGFWAMTRACQTLKSWVDAGNKPVFMAINVSAVQFWQSSFETEVKSVIQSTGIDPSLIMLEVTEGIFLDKSNIRVRTCFDELAKLGVQLAIDDFGTGFSSLGYLNEMPFDKLKIDRCFVADVDKRPEKRKLLQGIIGLARGLGMTTVAEGAERLEEVVVLKALGCNAVQGFYFAKPQPFENWPAMIEQIEETAQAADSPLARSA
jgi:diguanylate cyclase (GGDEF)-like protein